MAHKCPPSTMKMFNLWSKIFSSLISVGKLVCFLILNILILSILQKWNARSVVTLRTNAPFLKDR